MLVIRDFLGTDGGYGGIGDVYELGQNGLPTDISCLVDGFRVPERQNGAIKLSEEFVPFLIGARFPIYSQMLVFEGIGESGAVRGHRQTGYGYLPGRFACFRRTQPSQ